MGLSNPAAAQQDTYGQFIPYSSIATGYETPVLTPSGSETKTCWGSVVKSGSTYHMFYSYNPTGGANAKIGHATSSDGKTWTKDAANNPVLDVGSGGKFDDKQVWLPIVWIEGSTWYMIYAGQKNADSHVAIGLATSSDGVNWTRQNSGDPVLEGDSGEWDQNNAEIGTVIKVGSTYYMWYNTITSSPRKIGLATSTDLINWTKDENNPIFEAASSNAGRFCPGIFKLSDWYYLIVPAYTHQTDYVEFEMYRSANPTFYESERVYLGSIRRTSRNRLNSTDMDTPFILTDDINRDSFDCTNGDIWCYYAAYDHGADWHTGLMVSAKSPIMPAIDNRFTARDGFGLGFFGKIAVGQQSGSDPFPSRELDINASRIRVRGYETIASAGASGSIGEICWDANYLYISVGTNNWHRVAHASW
ncbi:MAG: hypothetical protein ACFFC6_11365 [Promethearchaeota archaeon]